MADAQIIDIETADPAVLLDDLRDEVTKLRHLLEATWNYHRDGQTPDVAVSLLDAHDVAGSIEFTLDEIRQRLEGKRGS